MSHREHKHCPFPKVPEIVHNPKASVLARHLVTQKLDVLSRSCPLALIFTDLGDRKAALICILAFPSSHGFCPSPSISIFHLHTGPSISMLRNGCDLRLAHRTTGSLPSIGGRSTSVAMVDRSFNSWRCRTDPPPGRWRPWNVCVCVCVSLPISEHITCPTSPRLPLTQHEFNGSKGATPPTKKWPTKRWRGAENVHCFSHSGRI